MSSIIFDKPRFEEMQTFLLYIYTLGTDNSNIVINQGLVYRELYKYDLETDDISCKYLFDKWKERYKNKIGLSLLYDSSWPHFLKFYSTKDYFDFYQEKKYIKLYIPLKYKNMYKNVNDIFDFVSSSHIKHFSKIADIVRNDVIVMRLKRNDFVAVNKIINFISTHFDNNSVSKTNPFVPTIKGVGFTFDSGGSYNSEIASLISDYINHCINNKKNPILNEFIAWVNKKNNSEEVRDTFDYTIGKKNDIQLNTYNNEYNNKSKLFFDAVDATYKKYGMNHVILAVSNMVNRNDCGMITNADNCFRVKVKQKYSQDDIKAIVNFTLNKKNRIEKNDVVVFCYKLFSKDILMKLQKVCTITMEKYDYNQLFLALMNVISTNDYSGFARFSGDLNDRINYRELIAKIPPETIANVMKLSLGITILDNQKYDNDFIISSFINKYIKENKINLHNKIH